MNRKCLVLLIALCLVFLTSCGKNKAKTNDASINTTESVITETTEAVENGVAENPFDEEWEATEAAENARPNVPLPTPTKPAGAPVTEYEKYNAMSAEEQLEYMNSFESVDAFFEWYNAAKEEYDAQIPVIEVGEDPIDMGEFFEQSGE